VNLSFASGQELVSTNGCFLDVERESSRSESRAALERPEGRLRVGLRQPTLRIHRLKADIESLMPVSCRSLTRRFDPLLPVAI
jgi:hypothetical protein